MQAEAAKYFRELDKRIDSLIRSISEGREIDNPDEIKRLGVEIYCLHFASGLLRSLADYNSNLISKGNRQLSDKELVTSLLNLSRHQQLLHYKYFDHPAIKYSLLGYTFKDMGVFEYVENLDKMPKTDEVTKVIAEKKEEEKRVLGEHLRLPQPPLFSTIKIFPAKDTRDKGEPHER